jgi:hypothetical protein
MVVSSKIHTTQRDTVKGRNGPRNCIMSGLVRGDRHIDDRALKMIVL